MKAHNPARNKRLERKQIPIRNSVKKNRIDEDMLHMHGISIILTGMTWILGVFVTQQMLLNVTDRVFDRVL